MKNVPPRQVPGNGENFTELVAIMERLLAPDGCPWDQEQTLETLKPFLLEEAFEVLEALESGERAEHCDELGDLLFQIVFQAALRAREAGEGAFSINDVIGAIATKMVRRHPHVFGDLKVSGSSEVLANWAKLKEAERAAGGKQKRGLLDGVPRALPALLQGQRVGEKAAEVGFDWPDVAGVRAKLDEELAELDQAIAAGDHTAIEEELGDVLFTLTRLGPKLGVAPEDALRGAIRRFRARFVFMQARATAAGQPDLSKMSLTELDDLWRAAKRDLAAETLPKK